MEQKTVINERYEVLDTLGKGGMGLVLKCEDKMLKRTVAVKVLGDKPSSESIQRFQVEARAAAKLKHANILQVLDFGETNDGRLFLVMDYVDGGTLAQLLERRTFLPVVVAVSIFEQICQGISHAHEQGVLHRDIKPSNVMLVEVSDNEWLIKIVDFGIAKLTSEDQKLTTTGAVVGSPPYIAPEAALNQKVDVRSDIYSIGCLMFETLTGSPPYQGETAVATILMHSNEPVPTLASRSDEKFDPGIEKIIAKCLAKEPEERYKSVEELKSNLKLIDHSVVEQAEADSDDSPKQVSRTTSAIPLLVMAGAFLLLIIAGTVLSSSRTATENNSPAQTELTSPDQFLAIPDESALVRKTILVIGGGSVKAGTDTDDAQIEKQFDQLKNHKQWRLQQADITNKGVGMIARTKVTTLDVKKTEIDNDCMSTIGGIKNLTFLDVTGCRNVTLEGFRHLKNNDKLQNIQFSIPADRKAALLLLDTLEEIKHLGYMTIEGTMDGATIARLRNFKRTMHVKLDSPTEEGWKELTLADTGRTKFQLIHLDDADYIRARKLHLKNISPEKKAGPITDDTLDL